LASLIARILSRGILTEELDQPELASLGASLAQRARKLFGRSLWIREVDAGSCNGCEIEIVNLANPYYDLERFGFKIVASPRHADALLVTGPVTRNMELALRQTLEATPEPRLVIAVGDCAVSGGCFQSSYAVVGPVRRVVPVDLEIPGCPPTPAELLRGLLGALDRRVRTSPRP
jgi:Ni,Fe-hydrogenase III small subunit